MAEIKSDVKEYYKCERSFKEPNSIKGDWNGDGKTDYAMLLQKKNNVEKRIIAVLMRSRNSYKTYLLETEDGIMADKKGEKYYDFETQKSFPYKNDAIISYFREKSATSYIWAKGRFKSILTSD